MEKSFIYQKRREKLAQRFSRTLFVIPSGRKVLRSHSVAYSFQTASDFYYLTGLELDAAVLVIAGTQMYLLRNAVDSHRQQWGDEEEFTADELSRLNGVSLALRGQLEEILRDHARNFDRVAMPFGREAELDQRLWGLLCYEGRWRGRYDSSPVSLCDSRLLVGTLRLLKDEDEIERMRRAAQSSSRVLQNLISQKLVGRQEKEIAREIESGFLHEGLSGTAYETIVGAGLRSTILHARPTAQVVQQEQVVLIDAGGVFEGYCADITRVLPAGRMFSSRQKEVYQKVLDVQKAVIQEVAPGRTLQELHEMVVESFGEKFRMPHSTSHWLGLDVHDPAPYVDDRGNFLRLEAGMTFTIEPGIYLPEESIGVRIEDDVVVTSTGCEVLTNVAKEIDEIEALRTMV